MSIEQGNGVDSWLPWALKVTRDALASWRYFSFRGLYVYNDVAQNNFGKARMEALQDEAQTRRLVAAYEARESEKSLPKIKSSKSGLQRVMSWMIVSLKP